MDENWTRVFPLHNFNHYHILGMHCILSFTKCSWENATVLLRETEPGANSRGLCATNEKCVFIIQNMTGRKNPKTDQCCLLNSVVCAPLQAPTVQREAFWGFPIFAECLALLSFSWVWAFQMRLYSFMSVLLFWFFEWSGLCWLWAFNNTQLDWISSCFYLLCFS